MPKGLSSDSMIENTNLPEDYTMGDLIRNSNARQASKAKEAELREQIRFEHQQKELKKHLDGWIESNNNALSYMYLFGKDFNEGKSYYEKHGLYYEHSASELESIRLRNYLSDYVTDDQRMALREQYNKIMNAPKDDWQSQLLKNQMETNAATMNEFGQQNEAEIEVQVQAIAAAQKAEDERCDGFFNELKCAGESVGNFFGDALSFVGEGISKVPVIGDVAEFWSDRFEDVKTGADFLGQELKNSGKVGKFFFDAGDKLHEAGLKFHVAKAAGPLRHVISDSELHEMATGVSIEDQSLMGTAEFTAGVVVPGADVALLAHQAIQLNKAKQEQEAANNGKTDIENAIDNEYGSDNEEESQPQPTTGGKGDGSPMRLIREPQHSSKPKGQSKPPRATTAPAKVIKSNYWLGDGPVKNKEVEPPKLLPREPPQGYGQKPTSGGTCKPKRKPIPACN